MHHSCDFFAVGILDLKAVVADKVEVDDVVAVVLVEEAEEQGGPLTSEVLLPDIAGLL